MTVAVRSLRKAAAIARAESGCRRWVVVLALLAVVVACTTASEAAREKRSKPAPAQATESQPAPPAGATGVQGAPTAPSHPDKSTQPQGSPSATEPALTGTPTAPAAPPPEPASRAIAPETVEADVSTRSLAVTSAFSGSQVVVFGTVLNSRQETAESGLYDVVIVVEGATAPGVVRSKSSVGGIWLNTSSLKFDRIPSYYAIVSTRPLDEVADEAVLAQNLIGFDRIRFEGALGSGSGLTEADRGAFRNAIVRLKRKEGLYFTEDYGVAFIGKSLFRSTVTLPANVKVGPVTARVILFKDGEKLSEMSARVVLARQGLEQFVYGFAFSYPLLYGLLAVAIAVSAGFAASLAFGRRSA